MEGSKPPPYGLKQKADVGSARSKPMGTIDELAVLCVLGCLGCP